jgi:hypothetical protein
MLMFGLKIFILRLQRWAEIAHLNFIEKGKAQWWCYIAGMARHGREAENFYFEASTVGGDRPPELH